jgi:hypothetical protein
VAAGGQAAFQPLIGLAQHQLIFGLEGGKQGRDLFAPLFGDRQLKLQRGADQALGAQRADRAAQRVENLAPASSNGAMPGAQASRTIFETIPSALSSLPMYFNKTSTEKILSSGFSGLASDMQRSMKD